MSLYKCGKEMLGALCAMMVALLKVARRIFHPFPIEEGGGGEND